MSNFGWLAAALVALGGCAVEPAPPVTRPPGGADAGSKPDVLPTLAGRSSLIPSMGAEQARLGQALGAELAATLMRVDGVADARVHLVLAGRPPVLAARRQATPARASVLLKLSRHGVLTSAQVQGLVAGAVQGLEPSAVRVVLVKVPAPVKQAVSEVVRVGPFQVAPKSRSALLAVLCVGLLLIAALAALIIYLLLRRKPPASPPQEAPPDPDLESSLSLLTKTFRRR